MIRRAVIDSISTYQMFFPVLKTKLTVVTCLHLLYIFFTFFFRQNVYFNHDYSRNESAFISKHEMCIGLVLAD